MSFQLPSSTITLAAALRDLQHGSAKARAVAAHALGDVNADLPTVTKALLAALDDLHALVRAEAVASLAQLWSGGTAVRSSGAGPARARGAFLDAATTVPAYVMAAICKRLSDGDPAVRQNAAIALGTIGDPAGFAPLAEALATGSADVRFQAVTSMVEIAPAQSYQLLLGALDDRDHEVVGAAALGLGAIGDGAAVARLAPVLEHANPNVRFDVAYAMAHLGDGRGRAVLATALDDSERGWDAVLALTLLGQPADCDFLFECLNRRQPSDEVKAAAAGALLRLHDSRSAAAQAVLLKALQSRKDHLRGIVVEELRRLADPWALATLSQFRSSRKGRAFIDVIDETLAKAT
ncbi:MAG: HEAT repeat domain-containing protein [Kofleriaceae bacterium]|nr:HEAT repeat domain-containing protein [Kofleriaceae bacterium]